MKIAVIVPANVPYLECTIAWQSSLYELARLDPVVVFVGQGAFFHDPVPLSTVRAATAALRVDIIEASEECPARMAALRQSGAYTYRQADFYIMADANMEFVPGSAAKLLETIDFLNEHDEFGAVACSGFFGSVASGGAVVPYTAGKIISTAKGIVIRNDFNGQLFEEDQLKCLGGLEELLMCIFLNRRGKKIAKQFCHPTKHHDLRKMHQPDEPIHNKIHDLQVSAEAGTVKWIRDHIKWDYTFGDRIINLEYDSSGRPINLPRRVRHPLNHCTVHIPGATKTAYPSVQVAFQSIGLPLRKANELAAELKRNGGTAIINHNGIDYEFSSISS